MKVVELTVCFCLIWRSAFLNRTGGNVIVTSHPESCLCGFRFRPSHMWPRSDIDQLRRRSVLLRYTELLPSICLPVLLFLTQIPRCVTGPRCWWGNMRPGLSRFTRSCATDVEGRSPRHHKPQGRGGRGGEYEFPCLSFIDFGVISGSVCLRSGHTGQRAARTHHAQGEWQETEEEF